MNIIRATLCFVPLAMFAVLVAGCVWGDGKTVAKGPATPQIAVKEYLAAVVNGDRDLYLKVARADDEEFLNLSFVLASSSVAFQRLLRAKYGENSVDDFNDLLPDGETLVLREMLDDLKTLPENDIAVTHVDSQILCRVEHIDSLFVVVRGDGRYQVDVQAGVAPETVKTLYFRPHIRMISTGIEMLKGTPPDKLGGFVAQLLASDSK